MEGLLSAIEKLDTFPARCAIAPESRFFRREIRHLLHGTPGRRYRVLFTIEGATVHVLYIRRYAQDWVRAE